MKRSPSLQLLSMAGAGVLAVNEAGIRYGSHHLPQNHFKTQAISLNSILSDAGIRRFYY